MRIEPDEVRQQLAGKHACPFCGVIRADAQQPCPRCTMEDTAATRGATRQRIGPWFVLQARNPSAPGMKFVTLLQLVKKGHVTPRSIVRGPTSQQLWSFAAKLRGLSREFGLCWHCGEAVEPTSLTCGHCGTSQELPANPDVLFEPPETAPPDIMAHSKLPSADTGMDGGTSLDLQATDVPVPAQRTPQRAAVPAPLPARRVDRAIERTVPARPAMDRLPTKEEGILSARELAAAFQLDFKMPGEPGSKRKGSMLRTIVALLMITLISASITLALRPDWREQVFAAASDKWNGVRTVLEQPATPLSATPAANTKLTAARPVNKAPTPTPAREPETPPVAVTPPPVAPVEVPSAAPPAEPVATSPPPAPPEPAPPVVEVAPPVVVAPTPPSPPPAPPAAVPVLTQSPPAANPPAASPPTDTASINDLTIDQAIDRASQWRNEAIDAEAKHDWAGAVALYEKIGKLPKDAWPADIEMRLENARKRAGG